MSDVLHDRIRAAVDEARTATTMFPDFPFSDGWLAHCDHADRILDRHGPHPNMMRGGAPCCKVCHNWPCTEVRYLAEAWGVEP